MIGAQPDAGRFRSIMVVILALVCMLAFLYYSREWQQIAERTARDRMLTQLNSALALTMYQMTMDRRLVHLPEVERINPFVYLSIYQRLPSNYRGTVKNAQHADQPGWYFDLSSQEVYLVYSEGEMEAFAVQFVYDDSDGSGDFDLGVDTIRSLAIEKSPE